jgi:hypothetical protein
MQKRLIVSGLGAISVIGVLILVKTTLHRHHSGMYEKVGKSIAEKLKESKAALDMATTHVQGVFDRIRNLKP